MAAKANPKLVGGFVVGAVDDAVDRRPALRGNLDRTLANLAAASKSVRSFADQVDRRPNVVITGR